MATYTIFPTKTIFSLPSQLVERKSQNQNNQTVYIIALDCSGSMGDAYQLAVEGCQLIEAECFSQGYQKIHFLTFGSKVNSYLHTPDNYQESLLKLKKKELEGSTCLGEALVYIQSLFPKQSSTPVNVVFLTDGQETNNTRMLPSIIRNLTHSVSQYPYVKFDCIGFTSNHDVKLLNELVRISPQPGTFLYARDRADLTKTLEMLALTQTKQIVCHLLTETGNLQVILTDEGDTYTGEVTNLKEKFTSFLVEEQLIDLTEVQPTKDQLYSVEIDELMNRLTHLTNNYEKDHNLHRFTQQVFDLEKEIQEFQLNAMKIKSRELRKSLLNQALDVKQHLNQLISVLRDQYVSGDKLAKLLSGVHTLQLKKSLAKKIDKRIIKNQSNLQKWEQDVDKTVQEIQQNDLITPPQSSEDLPDCLLSLKSAIEAPLEGDCLCLCLSIGRSAVTAADPSRLVIYDITSTCVSWNSFMDGVESLLINLEPNVGSSQAVAQVLGDFSNNQGSTFRILSHQKVNACIPLYLNERHWKMSKHFIHQAMGLICTGNPLGSSQSQVEIVPFLLLSWQLQKTLQSPSENNCKIFTQLFQICSAVLQQYNLSEQLQSTLNQLDQPLMRTVDKIPSYPALIGQILSCPQPVTIPQKFYQWVVEEMYRRSLDITYRQLSAPEVDNLLSRLLNLDYSKYTYTPTHNASNFAAKIYQLLQLTPPTQQSSVQKSCPQYQGELSYGSLDTFFDQKIVRPIYLLTSLKQLTNYSEIVQAVLLKKTQLNQSAKMEDCLDQLGLPHNSKILTAFVAQALRDHTNADRRSAIEGNRYYDPFTQPDEIIVTIGRDLIKKRQEQIIAQSTQNYQNNVAQVFASTSDLVEAAGCVRSCRHFGDPLFRQLFTSLQQSSAILPVEKWKMLTSAVFNYENQTVNLLNVTWSPSKKNCNRLYNAHPYARP